MKSTGQDTAVWLPRLCQLLRGGHNGPEHGMLVLRSWLVEREGTPPEAPTLAITHLERAADRMRHQRLRDQGVPIGSGHVEATCEPQGLPPHGALRCRWKTPGGRADRTGAAKPSQRGGSKPPPSLCPLGTVPLGRARDGSAQGEIQTR